MSRSSNTLILNYNTIYKQQQNKLKKISVFFIYFSYILRAAIQTININLNCIITIISSQFNYIKSKTDKTFLIYFQIQ